MFAFLQSERSLLIAAALLTGTLTCAGQQLIVITPPAHQPYGLNKNDSPVADQITVGSQINGQLVTGVSILLTSSAPWLALNSDCTSPGASSVSVTTTAALNFCVDPSHAPGDGYYVALIRVTTPFDNSYPPLTVPVNLSRFPTGDLSPDPSTVALNSNQMSTTVSISEDPAGFSAGGSNLTVTAQLGQPNSPDGNWLQFNLKEANVTVTAPGEIDLQAVPANLTSQAPSYTNTIVLTDDFGDTKAITVTFSPQPGAVTQPVRSFAHIAPQPPFATQIILTNTTGQSINFTMKFLHDDGLSFSIPVTTTTGGTQMKDTITDSIVAFGANYYDLSNAGSDPVNVWGSAQLTAPAGVAGVALFRGVPDKKSYFEAAVPLSSGSNSFAAPFDQTISTVTNQQFVTGFAVANLDPSKTASVSCTGRDGGGHSISKGSLSFALQPNGHYAATLPSVFNGIRGTLTCTSTALVSAISLRFQGNEFTTLPVIPIQ